MNKHKEEGPRAAKRRRMIAVVAPLSAASSRNRKEKETTTARLPKRKPKGKQPLLQKKAAVTKYEDAGLECEDSEDEESISAAPDGAERGVDCSDKTDTVVVEYRLVKKGDVDKCKEPAQSAPVISGSNGKIH